VRRRWRKPWLKIHLYLALAVGLWFALLGVTGSLNVFYIEIDEWLNRETLTAAPRGEYQSLNSIMDAVRSVHPTRQDSWQLNMPRHERGMLTAWYHKPKETEHMFFGPLAVSVNPYTAEIVANRFWGDDIATWIYELHADLWLGKLGFQLVGIVGCLMIISLATGLYLWWPTPSRIKIAFTVKTGASAHRTLFDLHRVVGIYSLVVLLALAGSGVYLVFKDPVAALVGLFSPVQEKPLADKEVKSRRVAGAAPIALDRAVAIAQGVFPDAKLRSVTTPANPDGFYRVDMRQPGEANLYNHSSRVWLDQYSGEILAVRDPNRFSAGETFLNVLWPLHSGEAFGLVGRILVCLAGLAPGALLVTGLALWWRKQRARHPIEGAVNA
jgi:uncharacterized iron-regulated membrane protein